MIFFLFSTSEFLLMTTSGTSLPQTVFDTELMEKVRSGIYSAFASAYLRKFINLL